MTRILKATKIQETRLWTNLSTREGEDARILSANITVLCEEAIDRMKAMYSLAPQYTLHDDRHLLRTTELMALVLDGELEKLNIIELSLLTLSAFFHDQGMILSKDELLSLERDEDFQLFRSNWLLDHPNYGETAKQLRSSNYSEERKSKLAKQIAELDSTLLIDYVRMTHGRRSSEYVCSTYGSDKRLEVQGINLAPFLADLCEAHTFRGDALIHNGRFRYDEQIGTYSVNLPFLAAVLRLADILDFDRDRTPEVLLKSIHFTSAVSLNEWEKHRSVFGWHISPDLIRFTIKCKHPAYEAAARKYMDWIDEELTISNQVCRLQPRDTGCYCLNLPMQVDRSRIEPLDRNYRFHDLEFSLSRDEVVRLLMTDKLYGSEHLCIRELLQNSLDALRYRKALFSDSDAHWNEGHVEFRHYIDNDGYEVLECKDNGSGMDEEIVKNHFVRVGRSFYRSPFFERERNRLRASGNDFDPCSKFGIGFMSCFMLGDRITIKTRRDYGTGRSWGPPLLLEIHGLSGLLVVREGHPDQPVGTTVSVTSRQRPSFLDSWTDKIQLCRVLKGYALNTEFPIEALCDVPELEERLTIPNELETIPTLLEEAGVKNRKCFQKNLSEVSLLLGGYVRESFLTDSSGLPCLANSEAEWYGISEKTRKEWHLKLLPERKLDYEYKSYHGVPVCMDGILVAGPPGRPSFRQDVRMRLGVQNSNIYSCSPALIDARGELKPEITPGRTRPNDYGVRSPPGWRRLDEIFKQGIGLLWSEILDYVPSGLSPEIFWQLSVVHNVSVAWIPGNTLWDSLAVSLNSEDGTSWCLVRNVGELTINSNDNGFLLIDCQGRTIGPSTLLSNWEQTGEERPRLAWSMNMVVLLMSQVDLRDDKIVITPSANSCKEDILQQYAVSSEIGVSMFLVDYYGKLSNVLAAQTPYPTANRNHPLAKIAYRARHISNQTDLQSFAKAFVQCISETLSNKKDSPSIDEPGYWQKRVGHLYFSVDWSQCDKSLAPPYNLWTEGKGWFSFQENDFRKWRDSAARIN